MSIQVGFAGDLGVPQAKVQQFYDQHWNRKIALADQDFYKWQFSMPPQHNHKDLCVVAIENDKVLGAMGLSARPFYLSGKKRNGAELTTWIVDSEIQGGGAGAKILIFIKENFDVLIGMGITKAAIPIYMRSGFRFLKSIPRYIKILDAKRIDQIGTQDKLAKKLVKMWSRQSSSQLKLNEIDWQTETPSSTFPDLQLNHFERSASYLDWRYVQHPYFEYKSFKVYDETGNTGAYAYIVLREEVLQEVRIIHVMDIIGSEQAFPCVVRFVEDYAKEHDFEAIDFYCTSTRVSRFLLAGGWFSVLDDDCLQFPHLFHPVELRTPATTSLIYWSRDDMEELCDLSSLYVTKQDADLDRPTGQTIASLKKQ